MLVLERYKGQSLVIGGNIDVQVLGVNANGRVRLGITAPREIEVDKLEIYNRNQPSGRQTRGSEDKL